MFLIFCQNNFRLGRSWGTFQQCLIIFFACIAAKIIPVSVFTHITADACIYLDIARNFARGNGFVCAYNFYQYWGSDRLFYPAAPFMHPLFPLLSGVVWFFFHSIDAVILINLALSGINCCFLFFIVKKVYNSSIAFWSALLAGLCWPMQFTAIFPWSEQLHLFFLLGVVYLLLPDAAHKNRTLFFAGIFLGLSYLVRVSSFFNIFIIGFAILFIDGMTPRAFRRIFFFIFGFFLIVMCYQAFCYFQYGAFYPEYPLCGKIFNFSRIVGGYYSSVKPVLRLPLFSEESLLPYYFSNVPSHLWSFKQTFFENFNLLAWVFIVTSVLILKRKRFGEILFVSLGFFHILFFSLSFYWLPTAWLETQRYFLVPAVFWLPVCVSGVYHFQDALKEDAACCYRQRYFFMIMIFFLVMIGWKTMQMNFHYAKNIDVFRQRAVIQKQLFSWVQANSQPRDLIATSEFQYAFSMDRPIVSLPEGRVITNENLEFYLQVYHPKYIVISKDLAGVYQEVFRRHGSEEQIPDSLKAHYVIYGVR